MVGDTSGNNLCLGQPALAQLYGKTVKLVALRGLGLILIGTCQCYAGTVDKNFYDRALFRLCSIYRPTLQHIALQA
ncbi:hypothetical protein PPUJ13061_42180 [Pseudomonas putida]|nr:hypothetical protein PPUJ13061_42180 [Pseudomonas putida]